MAIAEQEITRHLSIPLDQGQQERLERAAFATGQTLEGFAVSMLLRAADEALASPPVTTLSDRDFEYFLSLRDSEAAPTPALVKAMEEHKRRLVDGSLQVED